MSTTLTVLCPSRGRPREAQELNASFIATRTNPGTRLVFVIDDDDPRFSEYGGELVTMSPSHGGGMVPALNAAALELAPKVELLGFVGDDHRFRSLGWDEQMLYQLLFYGFVFANDLAQMHRLPTQIFLRSSIVRELGWMGLPTCRHLYIDNVWLELGKASGSIKYLNEVVVEHMHPAYGKGVWDEGHVAVNTQERYEEDGRAFHAWRGSSQFQEDVRRVRRALDVAAAR